MAEKEKQQQSLVTVDGKDYKEDDLNDEQKAMVNHLYDLNRKIGSTEFNLIQLRFGRQAFVDALKLLWKKKLKASKNQQSNVLDKAIASALFVLSVVIAFSIREEKMLLVSLVALVVIGLRATKKVLDD